MPKVLQGLIYAAAIGLAGLGFRLVYMHYAVETINDATERCIGGSIVRVEMVNGVPTYTQVSDGARPVMCPMR